MISTLYLSSACLGCTILGMLITSIGTGIFTLHHFIDNNGIFWTVVIFAIFAILYYIGTDILILAVRHNKDATSFNDLIKKSLGSKIGVIFDIVFTLSNL